MTTSPSSHFSRRTLHVIDVENEFGTAAPTPATVRFISDEYMRASGWRTGDLTLIGSSRYCWRHAAFYWPTTCRWVWKDGEDGGELALLDALVDEPLWGIKRVVIGSGDHLFAEPAAWLAGAGFEVDVVCRPEALSRRLRLAAHNVTHISTFELSEAA